MDANERKCELDGVAARVIGAAYEVANVLGSGFLEKVYERALMRELASHGVNVKSQVSFPVSYKGQLVGEYLADLLVEDQVIVELKCVDAFSNEHTAQCGFNSSTECINYLKASHRKLALLINFQKPKVQWKRIVYGALIRVHSRRFAAKRFFLTFLRL